MTKTDFCLHTLLPLSNAQREFSRILALAQKIGESTEFYSVIYTPIKQGLMPQVHEK